MEIRIDYRVGKHYSGPDDQNFVQDTVFWKLEGGGDDIEPEREEEIISISRDLVGELEIPALPMKMAEKVAKLWCSGEMSGQFRFIYLMARALNCHTNARTARSPGDELQPEFDLNILCDQIQSTLEAEFGEVQAATAQVKSHPSALALAVQGDAEVLKAFLDTLPLKSELGSDKNESRKPQSKKRSFLARLRLSRGSDTSAEAAEDVHTLDDALLEENSSGKTPLYLAALFDNSECVKVLLEAAKRAGDALFKEVTAFGGTGAGSALYAALKKGHNDCILAFLYAGADFYAAARGDVFSRLKSGIEILVKNASSEPKTFMPVMKTVIRELAKSPSFDVNAELKNTRRRSRQGAARSDDQEMQTEEFDDAEEEQHEDADAEDDELGDEEEEGDPFMLGLPEELRRGWFGAERHRDTGLKPTLLSVAAENGGIDAVAYLIEAGARSEGPILQPVVSYIHYCRDRSYDIDELGPAGSSVNVISGLACMKTLIANGADVNAVEKFSERTALHYAAERGTVAAVKLLLDARADITLRERDGKTALELAEEYGSSEVVEILTRQNRLRRLLSPTMSSSRRRAQESAAEDLPDAAKCVICVENRKEVIAAPCGHKSMCRNCMRRLLIRPESERNCPVCRDKLESFVLSVYDV